MKTVQHIIEPGVTRDLARFELRDGAVLAHYFDDNYKIEVETFGIFTKTSGTVRPADGQAFYDALDIAYKNSSRMDVIERA